MENGRLTHSIVGAVVTWLLTLLTWLYSHAGVVTLTLAVFASLYSIQASRETTKLRREQRRRLTEDNFKDLDP